MNRTMPAVMSLCFVAVYSNLAIQADAGEKPSVTTGMEINSSYIYRGIVYNDGLVVQPWMETYIGPFTVGLWANMDLDDYDGSMQKRRFSEIDLTLSYTVTWAGLDASLTVAEYLYPNVADGEGGALPGDRELILRIGRKLFAGLSAETIFSYDFDQANDLHVALKVKFDHDFTDKFSVSTFALCSYIGKRLSETGKSGANEYDCRVTLSFAATETLAVSLRGGYTGTLDGDVLPDPAENAYGGIGVSAAF